MATSKNIKAVQKKSAPFVSSVKSVFQNYAPAPESSDHIQLKPQYNLFINGKFVKPLSKIYYDTINPATGKKIATVAKGNEKDIDAAVKAASKAFESWSKTDPKERAKYIYRIARMIQERAREFRFAIWKQ